jgi:hypothetical protein
MIFKEISDPPLVRSCDIESKTSYAQKPTPRFLTHMRWGIQVPKRAININFDSNDTTGRTNSAM